MVVVKNMTLEVLVPDENPIWNTDLLCDIHDLGQKIIL